jgi:predicted nucleotidyltransferase
MNTLTHQYIKELQADPNTVGIILFGSWARGNNRPDSDVDLLVIVQHGFARTVEYRGEQAFELTYTTEQAAIDYWESNLNDAIELWSIARVVFDRDGTMARLKHAGERLRAAGKPPLAPDQVAHARFDTSDQLKAIEALAPTDPTTARMLLSTKVAQLTELFFDLRQWWTPPPKQRLAAIKESNEYLYKLITQYYEEPMLIQQISIVYSIMTIVFE